MVEEEIRLWPRVDVYAKATYVGPSHNTGRCREKDCKEHNPCRSCRVVGAQVVK